MSVELFSITSYIDGDNLMLQGHYIDENNYSQPIECRITEILVEQEKFRCRAAGELRSYYAPWIEMDKDALICSFITTGYEPPSIKNIDVVNIANGVNMMEYAQIVEFPSDIPTAYSYVYKGYLDPSVPGGKYFERKPTFIRHHDIEGVGLEEGFSEEIMTFLENVNERMRRNNEVAFRNIDTIYGWGDHEVMDDESDDVPADAPISDIFAFLAGHAVQQLQQFEDVKVRLKDYEFKQICGTRKDKPAARETIFSSYCYRKMGIKFMNDMKIDGTVDCAICSEEIKKWSKVAVTPCKHIFHVVCAKKWFTEMCQRPTCPNCRHDIRTPV